MYIDVLLLTIHIHDRDCYVFLESYPVIWHSEKSSLPLRISLALQSALPEVNTAVQHSHNWHQHVCLLCCSSCLL